MWEYDGKRRPQFAEVPGPGQESVWDYPRPPRLQPDRRHVVVRSHGQVIADTTRSQRVLETASPPTFYLPPEDVVVALLREAPGISVCEWKGSASYIALDLTDCSAEPVGWRYGSPRKAFAALTGWFSFYPGRVECRIDGERVHPQAGGFYGGWVTSEIVGPAKGEPGTGHW